MPKMLFMGTNDPYWVIDNVKNYLPGIPGKNMIHYVPNAGHGLGNGKSAFQALSAFVGITLSNGKYPLCSWKKSENKHGVRLKIKTTKDILVGASIWYANSKDMDFRDEIWYKRSLNLKHTSKIKVTEQYPSSGYHAFYVNLIYKDPNGGEYTTSTRAFMTDSTHVL